MLLGLGGFAGSALFVKWRPILLSGSLMLLALAWYFTYRKPLTACSQDTGRAISSCKLAKATLWLATALILVITGFPIWSGLVMQRLELTTKAFSGAAAMQPSTLRVRIPSIDCGACAVLIQNRIRAQTGILSAEVTFREKSATVRYDPSQIAAAKIIAAINETGFKVESTNKGNSQ
jgi:copper chaperone CopZ